MERSHLSVPPGPFSPGLLRDLRRQSFRVSVPNKLSLSLPPSLPPSLWSGYSKTQRRKLRHAVQTVFTLIPRSRVSFLIVTDKLSLLLRRSPPAPSLLRRGRAFPSISLSFLLSVLSALSLSRSLSFSLDEQACTTAPQVPGQSCRICSAAFQISCLLSLAQTQPLALAGPPGEGHHIMYLPEGHHIMYLPEGHHVMYLHPCQKGRRRLIAESPLFYH
jgi:hypothetical protein